MDQYIITDTEALVDFCAEAAQEEFLSIDTEFMREHTYYPKLCLVQIGLQEKAVIIDPLAKNIDLTPLFALMQNENVLKVFHAARQDLEIFYVLMGTGVRSIFDTQVAAMAFGKNDQIAYNGLVKDVLGLDLDKGSRMTQWDKRPLSDAQLQYAFNDVIPLHQMYPILKEKIKGREDWIAEMHQRVTDTDSLVIDPKNAWKTVKSRNLKPAQLGALVVIAEWRERRAQNKDMPKRWVLSDESMLALAQNMPKTVANAENLRLKPKKVARLDEIVRIIAESTPINDSVNKKRRALPVNDDLLNIFRIALQHCSSEQGIATRLLCSMEELQSLASLSPDGSEWSQHPLQQGWRRDAFGLMAEKIARGEVSLRFERNKLRFDKV